MARLVRSAVTPALENVALWHERDISHSSVERGIGPDATIHLDFALARLTGVIDKLVVYPENMMKNLNQFRGLVHSQRVLLALTQKGVSREDSYRLVQRNAMKVWEEGKDFLTELKGDAEVTAALSEAELEEKFDLGYHTKHVDTIFQSGVRRLTGIRLVTSAKGRWPARQMVNAGKPGEIVEFQRRYYVGIASVLRRWMVWPRKMRADWRQVALRCFNGW